MEGKTLLDRLQSEKASKYSGGIYHKTQINLTYNSNHMEGSRLTHEQTRYIFETNTVGAGNEALNVDDIIETANHFRCIDVVIDCAEDELTEDLIKELHRILKTGTSDSRLEWFAVGEYKRLPNEVGGWKLRFRGRLPLRWVSFWVSTTKRRIKRWRICWNSMWRLNGYIHSRMGMDALAG